MAEAAGYSQQGTLLKFNGGVAISLIVGIAYDYPVIRVGCITGEVGLRITNKVLTDLAIWMMAFGILAGVAFPFFVLLLGISADQALAPGFFAATLSAGVAVGGLNFLIAHLVIRPRLRFLAGKMGEVSALISNATYTGDWSSCTPEKCAIKVDSEDEIGDSARAYNGLLDAFSESRHVEQAVDDFTQSLSVTLDFEELVENALTQLLIHTKAQAGAIVAEASGELEIAACRGIKEAESLLKNDHVRHVFHHGIETRLEMPEDLIVDGIVSNFKPREVCIIPVAFIDHTIAAVVLVSASGFIRDSLRIARLFRQGLGLAIQNALAHRHLQRVAALDPLTGVYNRRFGMKRLQEEFTRAVRTKGSLAVIMFDIDHFKKVNDTYGHLVGDRVIVSVCNVGQRILRKGDTFVRYGGEEFFAILPGASQEDAIEVAERIRHMMEETVVEDGKQKIVVNISAGVAVYPIQAADDEVALLDYADKKLYRAKQEGRNKVVH